VSRGRIALLLAYLEEQWKVLERIYAGLQGLGIEDEKDTVYAGYLLHNFYTAFEDLMREVARTFENTVDDTTRYHRELLKRMKLNVAGIRPALVSEASFRILNELRAFRHVFRHAYGYELEKEKVEHLVKKLKEGIDSVRKDVGAFRIFLEEELNPSPPESTNAPKYQ
jgi:uncharacterized protein YutE (UPF0331/DUF86 family)